MAATTNDARAAQRDHNDAATDQPWPEFYARRLRQQFGTV
jgi:hypothetical protein